MMTPIVFAIAIGLSVTALGTGKATLQGRLVYHDVDSLVDKPVRGAQILLSLAGDNEDFRVGGPDYPALSQAKRRHRIVCARGAGTAPYIRDGARNAPPRAARRSPAGRRFCRRGA